MPEAKAKGLSVIFHSGSYDRVHNGLAVALTALAMGREARLFFTYWSLEHLKRSGRSPLPLDAEAAEHRGVIEANLKKGHMKEIAELLRDAKQLGARIYACSGSMSILNIARDELMDQVDEIAGMASFLTEAEEDQLIFV